jgi:hypothetical protein
MILAFHHSALYSKYESFGSRFCVVQHPRILGRGLVMSVQLIHDQSACILVQVTSDGSKSTTFLAYEPSIPAFVCVRAEPMQ